MKGSLLLFLVFLNLAFCHVLQLEKRSRCKDEDPEIYCTSEIRARYCRKASFCENYLSKPICERGPKAFCKTAETAEECNKKELCLTWPDDSVSTIEIVEPVIENMDEDTFSSTYEADKIYRLTVLGYGTEMFF